MKVAIAVALLLGALIVALGPPFAKRPERGRHWFAPENILPMTFAHEDHKGEACVVCHHNFTDGTGMSNCMSCHVSSAGTWPLLEAQFHTLCRSCHEERDAQGKPHGPTRQCIDCHHADDKP